MVEAILSPKAHMASLGGPEASGTKGEGRIELVTSHLQPSASPMRKEKYSGPSSRAGEHQVGEGKNLVSAPSSDVEGVCCFYVDCKPHRSYNQSYVAPIEFTS